MHLHFVLLSSFFKDRQEHGSGLDLAWINGSGMDGSGKHSWMDGWINGWMDRGRMDEWMDKWICGWICGWIRDGWINGSVDGSVDGWTKDG